MRASTARTISPSTPDSSYAPMDGEFRTPHGRVVRSHAGLSDPVKSDSFCTNIGWLTPRVNRPALLGASKEST